MIVACEDCGASVESSDEYGMTLAPNYAWNVRAGDREPVMSKTPDVKHVGISDLTGRESALTAALKA